MDFTTHQRADLRWVYVIDGRESEKSWPTCGEAERAGFIAAKAGRPKNEAWKRYLVWAVLSLPLLWLLWWLSMMLFKL
ncbi:MAG: hypothetical protein WDM92_04610 [Caulobacteraceae bacterium]